MEKLIEWRHMLWLKVQLALPPPIQPLLHESKEIILTLSEPYLTVYQWQGQSRGGPLRVNYAGFEYARPYLKSMLFISEPEETEVGRVPLWQPSRFSHLPDSDLSYVVAGKRLVGQLPRQNSLVLPFWTRTALDIRGEWAEVEQRFREDARRNEVRKAKKFGYSYVISYDRADFENFYYTMYLPMMQRRHAVVDLLLTFEEAYEYFQRGMLLRVKRDGRYVAGGVCYPEQKVLYFIMIGVLDGDEQLMREGAVAAINYSRIQWAHEQGYEAVDFWGSRPYMTGLFLYKRKWGVTVSVPPNRYERIWLQVRRDTPAVRQFFKDNPCLVLDQQQDLWGLIITDAPDQLTSDAEAGWCKQYATPGLKGLLIRSVPDLLENRLYIRRESCKESS
ncbi:MAG: GNAT family N-acetyltransferase [Anaerolineales bacterium]|nr:GNAT family N-acetyltransferase [Anaerolineales bacterium]